MTQADFDAEVPKAVRILRVLRGVKQTVIADALQMTQPNYSKIENQLKAFTAGQLYIIGQELKLSVFQILALVHARNNLLYSHTTLTDILSDFLKSFAGEFDQQDYDVMMERIQLFRRHRSA